MRYRLTFDRLESRLPLDGDISQPVPDDIPPDDGPANDSTACDVSFPPGTPLDPPNLPLAPVPPPASTEWSNGTSSAGGSWPAPEGIVITDGEPGEGDQIIGVGFPDGTFFPVNGGPGENTNGNPLPEPPDLPPGGLPSTGPVAAPGPIAPF